MGTFKKNVRRPIPVEGPAHEPYGGLPRDMAAMVLQFVMFDGEARYKLTADPSLGLSHFYHGHEAGFVQRLGIVYGLEVTGAEPTINGLYHRREGNDNPPKYIDERPMTKKFWKELQGPIWYEKDDCAYICRHKWGLWTFRDRKGNCQYTAKGLASTSNHLLTEPPANGWFCVVWRVVSSTLRIELYKS